MDFDFNVFAVKCLWQLRNLYDVRKGFIQNLYFLFYLYDMNFDTYDCNRLEG